MTAAYEMIDSMSGSVTNEMESGETREVKRRYVIGQCQGFNDAVGTIEQYAPSYVDSDGAGFYWVRKRLDVAGIGNRYFDCTATYQTLVPKKDEDNEDGGGGQYIPGSLAWDTSGNTERKYQALSQEAFGDQGNTPDYEEAINVTGNGVEGVDVVVPGMRYSETWILPARQAFDEEYVGAVHRLTGTVNSSQFRAFEPGEALFMGARCQFQGDQPYCTITFEFECRPNDDEYYVKAIEPFEKKGWEYVWLRYQDAVQDAALVRRVVAAYKCRIYKEKDWSPLGIVARQIGNGSRPPLAPGTPTTAQQVAAFLGN